MPISSFSTKTRQKINIRSYLDELASLVGHSVNADDLGSIEQAVLMREASQKFVGQPSLCCQIAFEERSSMRFSDFVSRLYGANPASVYIWTPRTITCGVFLVPSVSAIKYDFDFDINADGVLAFLTSDLEDRLVLDFSESHTGEKIMSVETQGLNWGAVRY